MKDYASEEFWNQMWTAPLYSPMQILRLIPPLTKMFTAGCESSYLFVPFFKKSV